MNTQDPYRNIASWRRTDYPGYEDYLPYKNDWRYGLGFLSALMIAVIIYGYSKLEPSQVKAVENIAKSVNAMAKPAKDSMPKQTVSAQPTKVLANSAQAAAKAKLDGVRKVQSPAATHQVKPVAPFKPVTGPPSN